MQNTRGCLLELQKLASSGATSNQEEILGRITDLFFLTSGEQDDAERAVFGDVLARMAYRLEVEARARLAERLADIQEAPHNLICKLASDEIVVARPVLEKSPRLGDIDLVQVAKLHGQDHLFAISNRERLSAVVTDVLVERGNDTVLTNVTDNKNAEFSQESFGHLTTRAAENSDLYALLEVRTDLPTRMLGELKQSIANRLKTEIAEMPVSISGEEIDAIIEAKAAQMNLHAPDQRDGASENRSGRQALTENMVLAFARTRMLTETIQCLSLMSSLSFKRVAHCLLTADLTALAVLCKANDFNHTTFAALVQLRSASNPLPVRVVTDAMRHYELLNPDTARHAIKVVQKKSAGKSEA